MQQDMEYVFRNFFTHKDRLADPSTIPGTMCTPLSYIFIGGVFCLVVLGAYWMTQHKDRIRKVFLTNWIIFAVWEVLVFIFDSYCGNVKGIDYALALSLYPCSLYLYMMPIWLWTKNHWWKWMAGAYFCTLGMVGGAINLFYPAGQLAVYSCMSFLGFHTVFYHANILFTVITLLWSGEWRYTHIDHKRYLFMACIPTLLLSIPANIVNFSPINADYMYFTGRFPLLAFLFPGASRVAVTFFMYGLYIGIPPFFFLPSYISQMKKKKLREQGIAVDGSPKDRSLGRFGITLSKKLGK